MSGEQVDVVWSDNLERDLKNLQRLSSDIERKILGRIEKVDTSYEQLQEEYPTVVNFPNKIKLDVGGQIFRTTVEVLTREQSFFSSMFSGVYDLQKDEYDGSYFIDRDPTYFKYILEFCRTGKIRNPKKLSTFDKKGIKIEAKFYCMESLYQFLGGDMADYSDMHWSSEKKHSGINLREENMNCISTGSCSHKNVLGSLPIEEGGITWEIEMRQDADCYAAVGLVGGDFNTNNNETIGSSMNTWGVGIYPNIASGDRRAQATQRLSTGQIVKGDYNADEKTLKFTINGQDFGNWTNVDLEVAYICMTVCCNSSGGGYTLRNCEAY
jgi:hypothetical protein